MHEVLEQLRRELADGVSGLSAEETQTRYAPGKWSIQQAVEHLLMTYAATSSVVETRLAKGRGTKARPTLAQWAGQIGITRLGMFPKGRKAPPAVYPSDVTTRRLSGGEMTVQVEEKLSHMDDLLTRAETIFGGASAISHLVLGPMSVAQWRRFHLVHGEHHLKQIASALAMRPTDKS